MPGYTPFAFSSKKTQASTTELLTMAGGALGMGALAGGISDIINEMLAWYEMWVNPEKVDMQYQYVQSTKQTAGALVTFHYRRQNITMSVSGTTGWILNPTADISGKYSDAATSLLQKGSVKKSIATSAKGFARQAGIPGIASNDSIESVGKPLGAARVKNSSANSARLFLQRLRDIADEPMYYTDLYGVEHYNTKYIKIFTKQYPKGVICEGFFTNFNIPEGSDDKQTINYSFTFTVENLKPVSEAQRVLGKFAGSGKGSAIRSVTGVL